MKRAFFVTFEGIEGVGKSERIKDLFERIKGAGLSVEFFREPGGVLIAEAIRRILKSNDFSEMGDETELLLFEAARAQVVKEKLVPNLHKIDVVLADRFFDSTTAYQGYGRGIDISTINVVNHIACQGIVPDLTFLLDIPVETSFERLASERDRTDRIEKSGKEFFKKVRRGFLTIAKQEPERFMVIDSTATRGKNSEIIWQEFLKRSEFHKQKNEG